MIGLTARQQELLDYLKVSLAEHGRIPSYDEMTSAMGLKSKSNIHPLLSALEERGHIRRIPNRSRAIEIISPGHPVNLNREVHRLAEQYARSESITVETACNEALRAYFGGVR